MEGKYPSDEEITDVLAPVTQNVHWVKGVKIAEELGNAKAANVVILGALSEILEHDAEPWLKVIEARVPPKFVELNRKAFHAGRESVK